MTSISKSISLGKAVALAIFSAGLGSLATGAVLKAAPAQEAPAKQAAGEKPADAAAPTAGDTAASAAIDVDKAMAERSIGSPDAPITIIEYASMTCDHCAAFHNKVLPEVKKELVETGKARIVYRDMPWDKHALSAAKIARCAPPEKYFEVAEVIFRTHDNWAHSPDPLKGLKGIATAAGMDDAYVEACLVDQKLEAAILKAQQEGRKDYEVNSTPAFIFMKDGVRQGGFPEFEELFKKLGEHKH